ncbi:MAG: GldG family protein [Verrucomicrobiota bacterium]
MAKTEQSRFQWKLNHYFGLALLILIFVGFNYIAEKRYFRKNLSASNYTKLTDLSKNVVSNLKEEVEITNYISPQDDPYAGLIINDVDKLLEEYVYHSGGKIEVLKVDPYIDFDLAQETSDKYKIALQENVVIIRKGEQHRVLSYGELAEISGGNPYGGAQPKVTSFNAEQMITSTIQGLAQDSKSVIYFLTGHGEYDPKSDERDKLGISLLASYIERQNAEVRKLNLIQAGQVPDDANMLVIAGPRTMLAPQEIEMLAAYVKPADNQTGRLMLFLDPKTKTGLENLLADYDVVFRDDVALTRVMILGQLRLLGEAIVTDSHDHPAMEWLQGQKINMGLGRCRSIEIKMSEETQAASKAVSLLSTPESYWGEIGEPTNESEQGEEDIPGPLTVAALIDEGSVSGGEVNLKGDRIVAFGGAQFLTNQMLQGSQLDLFLNLMNWMLDKEESLGIAPKTAEEFNLSLDDKQKQILSGTIILLIPLSGLALGFFVWLRRRK